MKLFRSVLFLILFLFMSGCGRGGPFDIVLEDGRVIDPESRLDGIRNVGIHNGKIKAVTDKKISGKRIIDASGLVVSPGFIDLHDHGQSEEAFRLKALDGVTAAFELEVGTGDVAAWYAERGDSQLIHYGVSIGHIPIRMIVTGDAGDFLPSGPAKTTVTTEADIAEMVRRFEEGLNQGAVAVGFGIAYTPAATVKEFETMLRVAARYDASAHIHVRDGLSGLREAIAGAKNTGTALHVVHANSSGAEVTAEFLAIIEEARASGQDVTTEAYPYSASQTYIESALFDDWESWEPVRYNTFQWVDTGERLNRDSFARYRAAGGSVIIHARTEEMTRTAIESSLTMIASDGLIRDGKGHPRGSGSYARVLGRYVREEGVVELMDALRRMTIAPAHRLETRVPAMRNKGRMRIGADADFTLFDPETVIDRATYTDGAVASDGIEYVLVNGIPIVDGGKLVENVRPGRPVRVSQ
jgi:dihydroorotase